MRAASVLAVFAALALAGSSPAQDAAVGLPLRIQIGETPAIKVVLPVVNAPFVSVGGVGDVNGDGRGDFSVRVVQGHAGDTRRTFVVFGSDARTVPAHRLRTSGLELAGGPDVTGVGDLDRDGYDDVIGSGCSGGAITVVYGGRARGLVRLAGRGRAGYRITGLGDCAKAVSGTRNARRHLLAGGCGAVTPARGFAYLLPPRPRGSAGIHAPSAATARIGGSHFVCPIGLGDVNGDGRDDAVVTDGTDSIFVVFDALRRENVNLDSLGRRGFRIRHDTRSGRRDSRWRRQRRPPCRHRLR